MVPRETPSISPISPVHVAGQHVNVEVRHDSTEHFLPNTSTPRRMSLDLNDALKPLAEARKVESGSEYNSDDDDDGLYLRTSLEVPINQEDFDTIILARKGTLLPMYFCWIRSCF
jgi:hypothetical protein